MDKDREKALDEYFDLCRRTYEEMLRTGTWPWESDSTNPEDSVDSDSNHENV